MLPRYLDLIRGSEPGLRSNRLHDAYDAISMASRRFLDDLGRLDLSPNAYARLSETARRQRLLDNLEEAVHGLARLVSAAPAGSRLDRLFTNLVEGLDAALMTLVDALEGEEDSDDRRLLVHIAGDYEALLDARHSRYPRERRRRPRWRRQGLAADRDRTRRANILAVRRTGPIAR